MPDARSKPRSNEPERSLDNILNVARLSQSPPTCNVHASGGHISLEHSGDSAEGNPRVLMDVEKEVQNLDLSRTDGSAVNQSLPGRLRRSLGWIPRPGDPGPAIWSGAEKEHSHEAQHLVS